MNDEYKKMLERFEQICQNAKKELCGKNAKEQEKKLLKKIDKELTISEYDEIKYWLANVEILDNTDYLLNNRKAKILIRYLKEKDKEIAELEARLEMYENGVYFSSENDDLQQRIDKAIECINYYAIENSDYEKIYNIEEETLLNILGGKDG